MSNARIRRFVVGNLVIAALTITVWSAVAQAGPTATPTATPTPIPTPPAGAVDFPDSNLEAAVRAAIGKPTGWIYEADLAALTALVARYAEISDLTGLEYATKLTTLTLSNNQISDLSPLTGLTKLTTLWLSSNQISDLSPLAGLSNLTLLVLTLNQISDLSPLAGLTDLEMLFLNANRINHLSPLAELTNLTTLTLDNHRINDISALAGLTNLTTLTLSENLISDLSPLARLTNLTTLGLRVNRISNISALAGLTNLTTLTLFGNQVSDLSALAGLTNLTSLTVSYNQISDIGALAGLTKLTKLWLSDNQISDISTLVANVGIGSGDRIVLRENPLSEDSICVHIPALEARGVDVDWSPPDVIVCPSPTTTPTPTPMPTPMPTATPTATPTPGADCLCEVENINPNQVVLQNVGTGGKGSSATRKMVVTVHAVDAPGATCDPGEFSAPTSVNLKMEDDRGNIPIDSAKTIVCEQGVTRSVKRNVFFRGPLNCENGAVPPPKPDFSLGTITSTGSAPGTADYVEDIRLKCFE